MDKAIREAAGILAEAATLVAAVTLADKGILAGEVFPAAGATPADKDILVAAATPVDRDILADARIPAGAATLVNEATPVDEATTAGVMMTADGSGATMIDIAAAAASVSGSTARLTRIAPAIITSRTIAIPMATTINGAIGIPQPLAATPIRTGINVTQLPRGEVCSFPSTSSPSSQGASGLILPTITGRFPLLTEGSAITTGDSSQTDYNVVSTGFFEAVGVPVVHGRDFTPSDRDGGPPVAMVNQVLARTYWKNEDPIGKRIRIGTAGSTFFEVIGVAPDLEDANGPFNTVRPTVYVPYGQGKLFLKGVRTDTPPYQMQFLIRTSGDAARLKAALRQEALARDGSLRVHIQTAEEMLETMMGPMKTMSMLLSALGALALVMASVGIYAIMAYAVSQRTREIGIRIALGARRQEILALVMQRTVMLIAWGIGLGMTGALALNRIFSSVIADFGGLDSVTCISVALLLAVVALLASYMPARKALRVDPAQVLRCE